MTNKPQLAVACLATLALAVPAGAGLAGAADASAATGHGITAAERAQARESALAAGLQITAKHRVRPTVLVGGRRYPAPNPALADGLDPAQVDWGYWDAWARRHRGGQPETGPRLRHEEREAAGSHGLNDTQPTAEALHGFGSGPGEEDRALVLGQLSPPDSFAPDLDTVEDQGSIPLATDTGIGAATQAVTVTSEIGDGPHGGPGNTGDFDFFALTAEAGDVIRADTSGSDFDTVAVVYDEQGNIVTLDDDSGTGRASRIF